MRVIGAGINAQIAELHAASGRGQHALDRFSKRVREFASKIERAVRSLIRDKAGVW